MELYNRKILFKASFTQYISEIHQSCTKAVFPVVLPLSSTPSYECTRVCTHVPTNEHLFSALAYYQYSFSEHSFTRLSVGICFDFS